jgi:photosystem II stability/assembly factor-like uncharacterized protein
MFSNLNKGINKLWENGFVRRGFIVVFTSITILSSAASCNLPFTNLGTDSNLVLGVLKQTSGSDSFVKANALKTGEDTNVDGLTNTSVIKLVRVTKDTLFIITDKGGVYKSENGGVVWERKYLYEVTSSKEDEEEREAELRERLAKNNNFVVKDIVVNPSDDEVLYVSGSYEDVGKIFRSEDGGDSFKEVYTESEAKTDVRFLVVDENNTNRVYAALQKQALIKSEDGGETWKRLDSFEDDVVGVGFSKEFGNILYALLESDGMAISKDNGETWSIRSFIKYSGDSDSYTADHELPRAFDAIDLDRSYTGLRNRTSSTGEPYFRTYEKLIPVNPGAEGDKEPWIMIADGMIWLTEDLNSKAFRQVFLPVESEEYELLDVVYDPKVGLDRIIVSIDNKLYETKDKGVTWSADDKLKLRSEVGNISGVVIDEEDTSVIYLTLVQEDFRKKKGIFF